MRAFLFLVILSLARPAAALLPLPGPAVDWRPLKKSSLAAYDRLEAAYPNDPELHGIIAKVRELAAKVENDDRNDRDRKLLFVRDHGVPGYDSGELSFRVRWIREAHMRFLYASMLPRIFNEAFADAAKDMDVPGYPLTVGMTQAEYCAGYAPIAREIQELLSAQSPAFPPPGESFCDGKSAGGPGD